MSRDLRALRQARGFARPGHRGMPDAGMVRRRPDGEPLGRHHIHGRPHPARHGCGVVLANPGPLRSARRLRPVREKGTKLERFDLIPDIPLRMLVWHYGVARRSTPSATGNWATNGRSPRRTETATVGILGRRRHRQRDQHAAHDRGGLARAGAGGVLHHAPRIR